MNDKQWTYKGVVVNVVDGDTVDIFVDVGFRQSFTDRFRLFGINTPEIRGPEREKGLVSKKWLKDRVLGKEVVIDSHKDTRGKFGRWLADIWIDGVNVNKQLVDLGLAEEKHY